MMKRMLLKQMFLCTYDETIIPLNLITHKLKEVCLDYM